jgi:hypothetical protein
MTGDTDEPCQPFVPRFHEGIDGAPDSEEFFHVPDRPDIVYLPEVQVVCLQITRVS